MGQYGSASLCVAEAALGVGVGLGGSSGQSRLFAIIMAVFFVVTVPAVWRWAFVPYVTLTGDAVVVANALMTHRVPLEKIKTVEPGYHGLIIRERDGDAQVAWAVQKANWMRWTPQRTRSDDVADAIMDRVVQARAQRALAHAEHQQAVAPRAGQDSEAPDR
jgi:hypothetical protein